MTTDPLRSALSIKHVDETSLAVPSDTKLKSGQQRVLDQVHSIKRGKSKYVKTGSSSPSPTSPTTPQFNEFRWLKYSASTSDGSAFLKGNANGGTNFKKTVNSQQALHPNVDYLKGTGSTRRTVSTSGQWEKRFLSIGHANSRPVTRPSIYGNGLKTYRSDPELAPSGTLTRRSMSNSRSLATQPSLYSMSNANGSGVNSGSAQYMCQYSAPARGSSYSQLRNSVVYQDNSQFQFAAAPSHVSNTESKMSMPKVIGVEGNAADITMKEAVEYLMSLDENYQHCGASFIQHSTFTEDKAKQEVLQLKGIQPLVGLLRSSSTQVQLTASAALRNLVFKNDQNKEEVQRCGGIPEASALLRDTSVSETQKQLTGLLWNLSSAENLKPELIKTALPVLTESVLVPFTGSGEQSANINMDPDVFYNATGCLRNLCCGKKGNRKAIRNSRGLIDSLVGYVQDCVAADRPDDKSVENCVCVLHNLTYQLETEVPSHFSKITALAGAPSRGSAQQTPTSPIGCFSQQSSKVPQETTFDYPTIEDSNPKGVGWLFHSKAMQAYLSLLSDSQSEATKEACVGTLQNLTANKGIVSSVMSQAIVQKLNGLQHIAPLLQSSNPGIQRTAVALVGNLSRNPRLQRLMARQTLPQLVSILSSATQNGTDSDETMATACQAVGSLLVADPETGKRQLNNTFINSLNDLSRNSYFPKSSKASALLLYGLWAEKNFQAFLKKQGMNKSSFVNDITTSAHKSVQVL
ncbi:plakophilin-1-like [Anguilla rostrata]|uniref:plakophilin-1-like n=1 Tax=Anguilla rostrata TaxID=7938 RepID=UPI0030CAEA4C